MRVLIADDHAPTRDDIRRALSSDARFEVCAEAGNAAEAIHAALYQKPDICLLDLRMPGGGLATIWEIRARLSQMKIVVLTVSDDDTDLFGALRSGVDGYLLKTMDLSRLPNALNGVCCGEAAMRRLFRASFEYFRQPAPRWRQPAGAGAAQRLTSREWEVLGLLAQGSSTAKIAGRLVIRPCGAGAHCLDRA